MDGTRRFIAFLVLSCSAVAIPVYNQLAGAEPVSPTGEAVVYFLLMGGGLLQWFEAMRQSTDLFEIE